MAKILYIVSKSYSVYLFYWASTRGFLSYQALRCILLYYNEGFDKNPLKSVHGPGSVRIEGMFSTLYFQRYPASLASPNLTN